MLFVGLVHICFLFAYIYARLDSVEDDAKSTPVPAYARLARPRNALSLYDQGSSQLVIGLDNLCGVENLYSTRGEETYVAVCVYGPYRVPTRAIRTYIVFPISFCSSGHTINHNEVEAVILMRVCLTSGSWQDAAHSYPDSPKTSQSFALGASNGDLVGGNPRTPS